MSAGVGLGKRSGLINGIGEVDGTSWAASGFGKLHLFQCLSFDLRQRFKRPALPARGSTIGADAARSELSSEEIEHGYLTVLASLRGQLNIPIAVKLGPYFTNLSGFARMLDANGANGSVLFNRFYQPDIELETRDVAPNIWLSTSMDSRLPLRWIAILHGRVGCSLAATSGIHRGVDALKMLMAGADVTMLCSVLLPRGDAGSHDNLSSPKGGATTAIFMWSDACHIASPSTLLLRDHLQKWHFLPCSAG